MTPKRRCISHEVNRRMTRSMIKRAYILKGIPGSNDENETSITHKAPQKGVKKERRLTASGSRNLLPPLDALCFGLIQESVGHSLYSLLVAAILWNRTRGSQARPILKVMLSTYPTPEALAVASQADLANMLRPIGLYNTRAQRFLAFAQSWVKYPPARERRYRKLHYPFKGAGSDIAIGEVLGEDDPREGWEIAHLPAMGPYAIDSFRIFHRDELRGLASGWRGEGAEAGFEPEWKRVVPEDKDLRAYVEWMWLKEGWKWDASTGRRVKT